MAGSTDAYDIPARSAYQKYEVDNVVSVSSGLLVLPVASETGDTVVVRVHGGLSKRTVHYDIVKQGNPPVLPLPQDTDLDTLVTSQVNVMTPTPNENTGTYDWRAEGKYEYVTSGTQRQLGVSELPIMGFPYPNLRQDMLGAGLAPEGTEVLAQQYIEAGAVPNGQWFWPFTVYPSNMLMNPNLIS